MQYRSQKKKESPSRSHRQSFKKSEIKLQSFEFLKQTIFGKIKKKSTKPTKKSLSKVMKACGKAAEKRGPQAEKFKYVHKQLFQKSTSGKSNLSFSEKRESERVERLKLITSSGLKKDFKSVMEGLNQKVSDLTTHDLDEDTLSRPVVPVDAKAPSQFGRSVNPISTKEGRLCPPNNTGTPKFSDFPTALLSYEDMEMRTPQVGEKRPSEMIGNFLREIRNEVDIEKLNETVKIMSLDQGMETMTPQVVEKGPSVTFDDLLREIRNDVAIKGSNYFL